MLLTRRGGRLRALGYHGTPLSARDSFVRQLDYLARAYEPLDGAGLDLFFSDEEAANPPARRPALVISFDDGLLSNYEVAAPLLEERGMRGFFFVTTGLPDAGGSAAFCAAHEIKLPAGEERGMVWDEIHDLGARGHVIGCHTASHFRMRDPVEPGRIDLEIPAAKRRLEAELGAPVRHFAWVGGEPDTYAPDALRALRDCRFEYVFTTQSDLLQRGGDSLMIHRTILDADMPYASFRAKLAGLSDLAHTGRRRSIEAVFGEKA
jgi:peptidoglycan/xylan/chitin deacetylase (PgdA/CDA1 family)